MRTFGTDDNAASTRGAVRVAVVAIVGLIGAVVLLVGLFPVWGHFRQREALERFEREVGPVEPESYAPAALPPDGNAARWLLAASESLATDSDIQRALSRLGRRPADQWGEADHEAFAGLLEANQEARALMQRAERLDGCSFDLEYSAGFETMEMPDYFLLNKNAHLLSGEVVWRVERAEIDEALWALHLMSRLAGCLRHEPVMISVMYGMAVERLYYVRMAEIIDRLEPVGLASVARDLDHLEGLAAPYSKVFGLEGSASYQAWRSDRYRSELDEDSLFGLVGPVFGSLFRAELLDQWTDLSLAADGPAEAFPPASPRGLWPWQRAAAMVVPVLTDAVTRGHATRGVRELARAALVVRLAALETGSYPEGLDSSSTEWRSEYTGERILYEVGPDGSAVLELPMAAARWAAIDAGRPNHALSFRWRLPPVESTAPSG